VLVAFCGGLRTGREQRLDEVMQRCEHGLRPTPSALQLSQLRSCGDRGGRGDAYFRRWSCGARLPLADSGRAFGLVWLETSNRIPDIDPGVR